MTTEGRGSLPDDIEGEGLRPSASPAAEEGADSARSRGQRKQLPLWQESLLLLVIALGLAVIIKTLFLQAFYIPSASMEPGLVEDDRILVQKVSYWGGNSPERGDVVVFKDPGGWLGASAAQGPDNLLVTAMTKIGLYPTGGHLVKRVIGVGGDTVECCDEEGRLIVNGEPIDEPYVRADVCNGPANGGCEVGWDTGVIPDGHIFVMGDNRGGSADSSGRLCRPDHETDCTNTGAFVPDDLVVGKVFVLMWPFSRFDWIGNPGSFDSVPNAS